MVNKRPRIMVVDDEPYMCTTLEAIFKDEGYEVATASDGYEAISQAKSASFDLIFMDIKLPGINGVEAYREIKSISPDTVVVVMTGFALEDLVKEALEEGAYAVIYKPFAVEQILDIVQAVLQTAVVLVVDDQAGDREALRAILEDAGYTVFEAEHGRQAIGMALERHYQVILMDIRMPGLNGMETFQRIREVDPQVKVVFITGYELDAFTAEALRQGAYNVLTKPVDVEQMLCLIRSITGQAIPQ